MITHEIREYAAAHPYSLDQLRLVVAGEEPPAGDNPSHVTHFGSYRAVLTLEEQLSGWMWHVSLSTTESTTSKEDVDAILDTLELDSLDEGTSTMYVERIDPYGDVLHILQFAEAEYDGSKTNAGVII